MLVRVLAVLLSIQLLANGLAKAKEDGLSGLLPSMWKIQVKFWLLDLIVAFIWGVNQWWTRYDLITERDRLGEVVPLARNLLSLSNTLNLPRGRGLQ